MSFKILLLENIHPCAAESLGREGIQTECLKGALGELELTQALNGFQGLGIRSKTRVTAKVLEANPQLVAIGAFCIGTNQIDLRATSRHGVAAFNAPYSNTRSVAELVLSEAIALSRRLGDVNSAAHRGEWDKSAKDVHEVRGKTLGIVGYGHIGSQVSVLAEALGMRVLYYDVIKKLPLGNARSVAKLNDLLSQSDIVTLHVPETDQTQNMLGAAELRRMRPNAKLINASRGTVVVIPALAEAIREKRLGGAAIDVFPVEPESNGEKFVSELQGLPNVILTPHVGGSTEEAQEAIGREVSQSLISYFHAGLTLHAVGFPALNCPPHTEGVARMVNVHRNVPGVLGEINGICSAAGANIRAQYLGTDQNIGYLVVDLETAAADTVCRGVSQLSTSIRTRLL